MLVYLLERIGDKIGFEKDTEYSYELSMILIYISRDFTRSESYLSSESFMKTHNSMFQWEHPKKWNFKYHFQVVHSTTRLY